LKEIQENAASSHAQSNAERKNYALQQQAVKEIEEEFIEPTKLNPPMKLVI
jgi:hypothetical protein